MLGSRIGYIDRRELQIIGKGRKVEGIKKLNKNKGKKTGRSLLLEHKVLDGMADGVLMTDREGKILFLNRSLKKLFKIPGKVSDIKEFQEKARCRYLIQGFVVIVPQSFVFLR